MNIVNDQSLGKFSSMGLGGIAKHVVEVTTRMELLEALSWAQTQGLTPIMIGSGTNIIWRDEGFNGLLIVNKIMKFEVFNEDETNAYVTVGAGENWDSVVERCVAQSLTGIEGLSLIPGTAGATPVQNVGAYGQDISQTLTTVEAFDTEARDFVVMRGSDCSFGYRSSRFNSTDRGRFYITGITLHLQKGSPQPPYYGSVQTYFDEHNVTDITPTTMREAVIAIRSSKLPDPAKVRNNGSFFANPVIDADNFALLELDYPNIPHWPVDNNKGYKLSAAWLMEQCGFKNYYDEQTGMSTWPQQPLVLVNTRATSTAQLLAFKQKIIDKVHEQFHVTLKQEPELLPLD